MKLDQLRKIIREEVRAAVKEELQEMLTEAVKVASKPDVNPGFKPAPQPGTTDWSSAKPKLNKKELAEMIGLKPPPKPTNIEFTKNSKLQEALAQTQASMTGDDVSTMMGGAGVAKPNFATSMANQMGMSGPQPGLDISNLDFVSKAKSIYDASMKKSKGQLV
jgi:hypothetical protein